MKEEQSPAAEPAKWTTTDIDFHLYTALDHLKALKPNDRSELDWCYSVLITDAKKLLALYRQWVMPS